LPLANAEWAGLAERIGLSHESYGTARMLAGSPRAERDVAATMALDPVFEAREPVVLETLGKDPARCYEDLGLVLAGREASAAVVPQLRAAFDCLAQVPEVARAAGSVLATIHVVVPEGADYDVSFSDPRLPFSIFVGVSQEPSRHSDLRLAEGILHECMHLQLTLVEGVLPLVSGTDARHHSPWQNTMRPAQGVLHGTYVFAVIHDFMVAVLAQDIRDQCRRRHIEDRISTCGAEIAEATTALLAGDGLSETGRRFVERLRR